jgi:hypothetical protein
MTTLYIYLTETNEVVAKINADCNQDCEAVAAHQYGDTDRYGWTYSPAFGANDGLTDNADAVIINQA